MNSNGASRTRDESLIPDHSKTLISAGSIVVPPFESPHETKFEFHKLFTG